MGTALASRTKLELRNIDSRVKVKISVYIDKYTCMYALNILQANNKTRYPNFFAAFLFPSSNFLLCTYIVCNKVISKTEGGLIL